MHFVLPESIYVFHVDMIGCLLLLCLCRCVWISWIVLSKIALVIWPVVEGDHCFI